MSILGGVLFSAVQKLTTKAAGFVPDEVNIVMDYKSNFGQTICRDHSGNFHQTEKRPIDKISGQQKQAVDLITNKLKKITGADKFDRLEITPRKLPEFVGVEISAYYVNAEGKKLKEIHKIIL